VLRAVVQRSREALLAPSSIIRAGELAMGATVVVLAAKTVLAPMFADLTLQGIHDWDSAAAYRYMTVLALKKFHEWPWYHPYLCGGFPAWAYIEGVPNLISIYLPFYLVLPFLTAIRVEIVGSVATSIVGAYALASRYTKNIALRTLVAAAYSLNGRWALQTTAGHSWHLQYAWSPVALFFFDIACDRGRTKWALAAGGVLAMMLYQGGIYPVPHTALILVFFGIFRAVSERSMRPLGAVAIAGTSAVGFCAPKLFPILELMRRYPRTIESKEAIGLNELVALLTSPDQSFSRGVAPVPAYGWHEWGMYVGAPLAVAMCLAIGCARRPRDTAAKLAGLFLFALSLGAFAEFAPWTLLHKLPVFSSQHVPSRFMYLGFLCLMLAFVGWLGGRLDRPFARRTWLGTLAWIPCWYIVMNIAEVSRVTTEEAFRLRLPAVTWHTDFKQISYPSYNYDPPGAWAGPSLPAMMSNEGFLGCYSMPDRGEPHGAVAVGTPGYRGEAYFEEGGGSAQITKWSPNGAEIEYANATPGAVLVYNMNYDPGWRADGRRSLDYKHAVAARVGAARGKVSFRYFPPAFPLGILAFLVTAILAGWGGVLGSAAGGAIRALGRRLTHARPDVKVA
jgi:hypothetical protein